MDSQLAGEMLRGERKVNAVTKPELVLTEPNYVFYLYVDGDGATEAPFGDYKVSSGSLDYFVHRACGIEVTRQKKQAFYSEHTVRAEVYHLEDGAVVKQEYEARTDGKWVEGETGEVL